MSDFENYTNERKYWFRDKKTLQKSLKLGTLHESGKILEEFCPNVSETCGEFRPTIHVTILYS